MLEEQSAESGRSSEQEFATMREYYGVMKEAVHRGMHEDTTSRSGLTGMDAQRVGAYNAADEPCLGGPAGQAMVYALAVSEVNASMGRIIATPTAGSCGIIPGVFLSCHNGLAGMMTIWLPVCSLQERSVMSLPTIRLYLVQRVAVRRRSAYHRDGGRSFNRTAWRNACTSSACCWTGA